jgi:hypothetical protein
MASLVGPATTAIGNGLGKIGEAFGKLPTVMSRKDVINGINIAFSILATGINVVTKAVSLSMSAWDRFTSNLHGMASTFDQVRHGLADIGDSMLHGLEGIPGSIAAIASKMVAPFRPIPGQIKAGTRQSRSCGLKQL